MSEHTQEVTRGAERAEREEQHRRPNKDGLMPVTARGEATRRRILDAAEVVFGELGYYEASIAEITRRAGVAQGTFYIYFRTKREIFLELVRDLGRRLREASHSATSGLSDRLEIERQGFAAFFRFAAAHRSVYRIVQEAERVAPEAAQEYYESISRGYIRGLRAAMEAGEIRRLDAETLAYALMGIGHFIALRWIIWPQAEESREDEQEQASTVPPRVFATLMDFIAHGLATRPAPQSSAADESGSSPAP
jgi:AcrR family transcriptional regulator